jgi:hypothetical protein
MVKVDLLQAFKVMRNQLPRYTSGCWRLRQLIVAEPFRIHNFRGVDMNVARFILRKKNRALIGRGKARVDCGNSPKKNKALKKL